MARTAAQYVCQDCGALHGKWTGRCDGCGAWNSVVEEVPAEAVPDDLALVDHRDPVGDLARARHVVGDGQGRRAKFGMLFQGAALFDGMEVWQNVAFRLMNGHGLSKSAAKELALDKLALVGLGPSVAEMSPD